MKKKAGLETDDEVMESDKIIRGLNLKASEPCIWPWPKQASRKNPTHSHVRFHKINDEPECREDESAQKGNEENQKKIF